MVYVYAPNSPQSSSVQIPSKSWKKSSSFEPHCSIWILQVLKRTINEKPVGKRLMQSLEWGVTLIAEWRNGGMAEWRNLPPNTKTRNGGIYPQTLERRMAESPRVTLKRGMNMINNISMHFCMSFLPFSLGLFHYVVPVPLWFFVMILVSFVPVPRFSVRHP